MKNNKGKTLLKNTVMLYILQFSSYFFNLLTVPYQTRVLGPELYGVLGVAVAVMAYFQVFMDFGFLLSATEDVSLNRDNKAYINKKITSVAIIKGAFSIVSLGVMGVLCLTVNKFTEQKLLYFLYLFAYIANSFMPDYIYRGLEKMTAVTVRTVLIKLFFCVMTFAFLHSKEDYLVVPLLLLIGNLGAVVFAYFHLFKTFKFSFCKVSFAEIWHDFKRSSTFFYSRVATTVYTATNTVVLGMVDATGVITGYYSSADKVVNVAKSGLSPISDSLYPYMVKNKDFKLVKKILMVLMPIIVAGCLVVGIFAEPLCVIAFGKEFAGTAAILQAFLPVVVAALPSYIFGFPTLSAMGLSKHANYSIFAGTVIHIVGMIVLFMTGHVSGVTLAFMTSISEWSILLYRIAVVYKNRRLMKRPE